MNNNQNEVILYQPDNSVELEVLLENETVWLTRQQMSILFDRDIKTIGKHINNALKEELAEFSVVAKFATTATDGKTYQVAYNTVYHIGASFKDLGKKLFAFSKMEIKAAGILKNL